VLDAEVIENPQVAGNPLGSVVYRVGGQQINLHGPWPGMAEHCCHEPYDRVGGVDLAFRVEAAPGETRGSMAGGSRSASRHRSGEQ
jgi:hypothetical protein